MNQHILDTGTVRAHIRLILGGRDRLTMEYPRCPGTHRAAMRAIAEVLAAAGRDPEPSHEQAPGALIGAAAE